MHIVIRADASPDIGIGHVMRCLALAQAWQDLGGRATFAMALGASASEGRLSAEGMKVVQLAVRSGSAEDAKETAGLARTQGAAWVVLDGYDFGADCQRAIKESGLRLLCIDDNGHAGHYYADLVLNQNLHADESFYSNREPYTRLLLGSRYVLLRREFLKWRGWERPTPLVARKVLVTLGGGDPENVTLKVIQALQQVQDDGLEARVVVGPTNPHMEQLRSMIRPLGGSIRLETNVCSMPDCIAWADLAIAGAGCTLWELLFMRTPTLALIMADNQRLAAEEIGRQGLAEILGRANTLSLVDLAAAIRSLAINTSQRTALSRRATELSIAANLQEICTTMY
ncbi:MAG: UDP-2,4-diacetamido-2,4,6-trideoxy-beta-L-altropyranose hydrolase [Acidobacteria bacterium]|nr:UDP-2,4-diacetamido-2,4,6-trideoxy-beta-L-altropyranose hydrolase [Acidobacteriota bacterium]